MDLVALGQRADQEQCAAEEPLGFVEQIGIISATNMEAFTNFWALKHLRKGS